MAPVAVSAAVALLVGWAYIGSGLITRRQRPENRLGAVMVFSVLHQEERADRDGPQLRL